MTNRLGELDSLRGIAALIVLASHFITIFLMVEEKVISQYPYLPFLWDGHSAVIMFFVLSGFVLSLPFHLNTRFNYWDYLVKRLFRIYIPYLVIILAVVLVKVVLFSRIGTIPGLTPWGVWDTKISFTIIVQHILFIGEYNSDALLMVVWSLVHEMRISLIFPFIIFILNKTNWKISIVLGIILSVISSILIGQFPSEFNKPISTNYFITLHYISFFIMGALIAKHKNNLVNKIADLKIKYLLLPLGILFFTYPKITYSPILLLIGDIDFTLYLLIIDWIIGIGATIIILLSFGIKQFSKFLLTKSAQFLGGISYSLYLVHPIILISMVHVLYGNLPIPFILVASFIITMVVAVLNYKFIEVPSIRFGRKLTQLGYKDKGLVEKNKVN
ncbi:acyltransferase [Mesobacillus foraminis]|uniref:acyltransferase family protein n=1 Tax=Mesobacillus foraminis TaxID=279826 RepID=UPI0039A2FCC4